MTPTQRNNLLTLAAYLESLPRNYRHFDMNNYADHLGDCELPMPADRFAAKKPHEFLSNCGTIACAVGHGPAAGIPLTPKELRLTLLGTVDWYNYSERAFAAGDGVGYGPEVYDFLFSGDWACVDNHHYGAAARIRYLLEVGEGHWPDEDGVVELYAPYRKGSRSAKRREIDAVAA